MLVWAIYDIQKNRVRNKIVKLCKQKGLYRVQKSVFLGQIDKNRLDELALESKKLIDQEADSVYIFPMCDPDFKKVILLGCAFDKELVTDEIKSLFV
ncbi:MAG: CRISPR-associated endonuclease Cas2 [bacterium]